MNRLIYEIFDTMKSSNTECMDTALLNIENAVKNLLEPLNDTLTDEEYENLRDIVYGAAYAAEKEMFSVGFYFALDLLCKKS